MQEIVFEMYWVEGCIQQDIRMDWSLFWTVQRYIVLLIGSLRTGTHCARDVKIVILTWSIVRISGDNPPWTHNTSPSINWNTNTYIYIYTYNEIYSISINSLNSTALLLGRLFKNFITNTRQYYTTATKSLSSATLSRTHTLAS